jgi:hypothetical protein
LRSRCRLGEVRHACSCRLILLLRLRLHCLLLRLYCLLSPHWLQLLLRCLLLWLHCLLLLLRCLLLLLLQLCGPSQATKTCCRRTLHATIHPGRNFDPGFSALAVRWRTGGRSRCCSTRLASGLPLLLLLRLLLRLLLLRRQIGCGLPLLVLLRLLRFWLRLQLVLGSQRRRARRCSLHDHVTDITSHLARSCLH